jgi:trimeric autotransporter adhesin
LGAFAGSSLKGNSNNNIDIGNPGVAFESDTIRLGSEFQTRTFVAGIRGVTTGIADAVNVVTDSNGQLGTMSSSRRFKKEITPMDSASEAILGLKPVTFHYKSDTKDTPQFGLIAEEVAEVNPDLVICDEKGEVYTVRYDAVNAMLLNEFLKEHRKVEQLEKQIEALTAGLQKVSAQLEASKPTPQVVNNP